MVNVFGVDDAIRACGGTKTPIEPPRFAVLGMAVDPAPRLVPRWPSGEFGTLKR